MPRTLGSATPSRLAVPSAISGAFPKVYGTYTDSLGTITVPGGALNRWYAARNSSATARPEVICFGDSTTYGSGGLYSWLTEMRNKTIAKGLTDGGKGIFGGGEGISGSPITYDVPGEVNGYVSDNLSSAGGSAQDQYDVLAGQFYYDGGDVGGRAVTLQFKGTCCRIWYSTRANSGDFTYSLDGGSAVVVPTHSSSGNSCSFLYLSGLSNTLHTIVFTNRGGRTAVPPTGVTASSGSGGTFTAQTLYYVATYVFGGGETQASNVASVTVSASQKVTVSVPEVGQNSVKIYRGSSSGGPFVHIPSADTRVGGNSSVGFYTDDAAYSNDGTNPPGTGTTNLNTSASAMYVALAPMFDNGIVWQKYATSGATLNTFMVPTSGGTSSPVARVAPAFGLSQLADGIDPTIAGNYSVDTSITSTGRVQPALAILDLGFNDLSNASYTAANDYTPGVNVFAALCQAAGVDGLVLSGQLPYNANWPTYGATAYNAMKTAALAKGLAFADFFYPVGGPSLSYSGGTQNPHLFKSQYVSQADWLWDNLLGL